MKSLMCLISRQQLEYWKKGCEQNQSENVAVMIGNILDSSGPEYIAAQSELAALRKERSALIAADIRKNGEVRELHRELAELREELATVRRGKENADLALTTQTKNKNHYKRRAMAAEQRNATLETLVRQFQGVAYGGFLDDDHLLRMQRDIDAALTKPTESGASECEN